MQTEIIKSFIEKHAGRLSKTIAYFITNILNVLIAILIAAMIITIPLPSPEMKISDPSSGEFLDVKKDKDGKDICVIEVNGKALEWSDFYIGWGGKTLKKLGIEKNLWLAVSNHENPEDWWPQRRIYYWNGSWHAPVSLGASGPDSNGKEFDIAVIILDKRDDIEFSNYLEIGKRSNSYAPLILPPNAIIADKVNVTRINRSDGRYADGL